MTLPVSLRRGWCPSLFTPMPSGDGLLLRLKPRLGVFMSETAHAVADAAARLGNGKMALTNRGNLQLRGFTAETAKEFAAIAVDLGLAHPEAAGELQRNVLVSPLIGLDPTLDPGTLDAARMLDDLLTRHTEFARLSGKFGIVVCGGGLLPVASSLGDVLVQPQGEAVLISLDGGNVSALVLLAELRDAIQRLLFAFIDDGPHRRMSDADEAAIFARAGLVADMPRQNPASRSPIGELPGAFGIGIPFGLFDAAQLHDLADLAAKDGDATLRMTPWRAFILPGLRRFARNDQWIFEPQDPRLRIAACPGAPSCASASVDTVAAANLMADRAQWDGTLHISGCAKGCAHPSDATLALVGEDGLWNVIRDGGANSESLLRGLTIGSIVETAQRPQ